MPEPKARLKVSLQSEITTPVEAGRGVSFGGTPINAKKGGCTHAQNAIAGRSFHQHAEGHLLRREADPEGAAANGKEGRLRRAARRLRAASGGDRRPCRASGASLRALRRQGKR